MLVVLWLATEPVEVSFEEVAVSVEVLEDFEAVDVEDTEDTGGARLDEVVLIASDDELDLV